MKFEAKGTTWIGGVAERLRWWPPDRDSTPCHDQLCYDEMTSRLYRLMVLRYAHHTNEQARYAILGDQAMEKWHQAQAVEAEEMLRQAGALV